MARVRRIAVAYITLADRLLVFSHPDAPEAGIQVPAGSVKDREEPHEAVMREAFEETGLSRLRFEVFLGDRRISPPGWDEIHHCFFYHLTCEDVPPARWRHDETDPADGSHGPITFEFFWAALPDGLPVLSGGQDAMIPRLLERLGIERS